MATYKKIIKLVSKYRTPKPSQEFWKDFDKGLERKLDAVDIQRSRPSIFADKIKDAFERLFRPDIRPAVVAVSLIVMIIGATLFFTKYQGMRFEPVAALSDEELVDELTIINGLANEVSQLPQEGEVTNGILDELELLYEINPSFKLS